MGPPGFVFQIAGEWVGYPVSLLLFFVLLLAGIGTGVLFALSIAAYHRRRTQKYALVAVAVGVLFARSIIGLGTVLGRVPMPIHHIIEHGFDFVIAALVLYAVYKSGPE